jgi:hypothetical protein
LQQAHKSRTDSLTFREQLTGCGLTERHYTRFDELLAELEKAAGSQKQAHDYAESLTRSEVESKRKVKRYKRRLERAVKLLLAEDDSSGLTREDFAGRISDSTPLSVVYLDRIKPHVAKIDEALKPYFSNQSPLAELLSLRAELVQSDAKQEAARDDAPAETLKLYATKGEMLELIERINDTAHLAFDGDAETLARFNKDLLLRATRTSRKKADKTVEQPAPSPSVA